MKMYPKTTSQQGSVLEVDHSPIEISYFGLLQMGALCCLLAVGIVVQLAFLKPTPNKAMALRSIVIPEASSGTISDGYQYRHFIAQIVQRSKNHNFFEGRDLSDLIIRVSLEENIDPLFVAAIIKAESTFMPGVVSKQGAHGLMQIQANTGEYISDLIDEPWQGERFLHDPEYNLRLGITYLKYLSGKFDGNIERVLAAYNWGPAKVTRLGRQLVNMPDVTKKYIGLVLGNHRRWKAELKFQRAAVEKLKTKDLA